MPELMSSQPANMGSAPASKLSRFCDAAIQWSLFGLVLLMPLFYLPWTIEVLEMNKQLLLLVGAGIAGFAWLGKMLTERRFEYRRSVVNLIVILFAVVYAISAMLSQSQYMSVAGDFGQQNAGLVTVLSLVVLYFVIASNVRTVKQFNRLMLASVISGFLAAAFGLLQGMGVFLLPFAFAKSASFNTVGTAASLGIYLAYIVTLCGGLILQTHKRSDMKPKLHLAYTVFLAVTAVLSMFVIATIAFWPVTVCLLVASALLIAFAFIHAKSLKGIGGIMLPVAAFIVSLLLLFVRFPVALGFPSEVMPSMKASWDITVKSLRANPLLGSGPGTFIFDYAKYRAPEVNLTQFWNLRFDRSAMRALTVAATAGLLGFLTWLLVAVFLLVSSARQLLKADEETWHILISMFAAWFLLVLSKFLYSSTMTLEFLTWVTMALLVVVHRRDFFSVTFENSPRSAMTLSFVFIFSLVFAVSGFFVEGMRYAGEVAYADAIRLDQSGGKIDDVVNKLVSASNLNQKNDVYLRNLSTALLVKADQESAAPIDTKKKDKEKDADYKKRMDDAQQEKIRTVAALTADAVNVAKRATDLNPSNVADWSVLASIYQNLIGVTDGADEWAVKSYQTAVDLEPNNPSTHTELGKVYMVQSDMALPATDTKDEKAKKDAQEKVDKLLGNAVDEFNKAIALKADYAPAHFNLALALDRQGKLKEAITKMENTVQLQPTDVGVGFQLALLYYRDSRKDDAMRLLESVVSLSPNYSNARWYLAAMYEEKGNIDGAIEQIQKVAELNPGNDTVTKKLSDLQGKKSGGAGLPAPVDQPVQNVNEPGVKR